LLGITDSARFAAGTAGTGNGSNAGIHNTTTTSSSSSAPTLSISIKKRAPPAVRQLSDGEIPEFPDDEAPPYGSDRARGGGGDEGSGSLYLSLSIPKSGTGARKSTDGRDRATSTGADTLKISLKK